TEDHRVSPSGKPGTGPVKESPWYFHTGSPSSFLTYSSVDKLPVRRRPKVETSTMDSEHDGDESASADVSSDMDIGTLASVACSLLMKVLWAARSARPDLLRAVNHIATKVTKWTSTCDSMIQRLMGYIQATLHLTIVGWVGDSRKQLFPHVFPDAEFAGMWRLNGRPVAITR
ncbi:MAG: hypothetical protein ACKPKO_10280, partial [Candidatus Fonsibacter sp.]